MHLGTRAILTPRKVGELEGSFFVPDYQRGYRWGKDEVSGCWTTSRRPAPPDYYLQPIVVKPMDDGRWELVDGQQRLTTLYLVLRSIREFLPQTELKFTAQLRDPAGQRRLPRRPAARTRRTRTSTTSTCIEASRVVNDVVRETGRTRRSRPSSCTARSRAPSTSSGTRRRRSRSSTRGRSSPDSTSAESR